jgi:DMSO/TMAO reductase YedYZ molybdopterin-dependent catalytic subunit
VTEVPIRVLVATESLLASEMNGERLAILHGRPLRLRVENQLGFEHVKWISGIGLSTTPQNATPEKAATTRTTSCSATATRSNDQRQGRKA